LCKWRGRRIAQKQQIRLRKASVDHGNLNARRVPADPQYTRDFPFWKLLSIFPMPLPAGGPTAAAGSTGPGATAHESPAGGPGCLSILQGEGPINPHILNSRSELMRLFVGRMILNGRRIENHHIRKVAGRQTAAMLE